MKVVLLESLGVSYEDMEDFKVKVENLGHEFQSYERSNDEDVLKERVKDAEILIIANMPLKESVIRSASKLKFINVAFTGVDHLDIDVCKELGIKVSNASGYSNQSVAELTICMMLSLLRNVKETEDRCRQLQNKDGLVGNEIANKTVGIIGVGQIGHRVAEILNVFGCKVLGYRRNPVKDDIVEYVDLENLLKSSDIVTIHCPLNESTKNLISEKELKMMKNSAILINAARGPICNQEDLVKALDNKVIRAAGIDVYDIEPPLISDHIMLKAKNTLLTPHIAFATKESMIYRKNIVLDNLVEYTKGKQINIVL